MQEVFMKAQFVTLREAAAQLNVPPHVITYSIVSGKVPEPAHISGRRMFTKEDIDNLRRHFDHERETHWRRGTNGH